MSGKFHLLPLTLLVLRECFQDPTESGTFVNGVKCSLCKKGITLPTEPLKYDSIWRCLSCQGTETSETMTAKMRTLQTRLDNIPDSRPDQLEEGLAELASCLHENHYLLTDTQRRIIDIYGHHKGYHYDDLGQTSCKLSQHFSNIILYIERFRSLIVLCRK